MWLFPKLTPLDIFFLISLNLLLVCWLAFIYFIIILCLLLAELLKVLEIILFAYPYTYISDPNLTPNYLQA